MTLYRVHMAGTPAAWLDINAHGYRIHDGLIRFKTGRDHDEATLFIQHNVFAIIPVADTDHWPVQERT